MRAMIGRILVLTGVQEELVKAVHATGKPVVVVLINGRPLCIPWIAENIPAIVEAWLPGEEAGNAVADVLFGDYNPGGKLPVSIPRSVGQQPVHYNRLKMSKSRRYISTRFRTALPLRLWSELHHLCLQ